MGTNRPEALDFGSTFKKDSLPLVWEISLFSAMQDSRGSILERAIKGATILSAMLLLQRIMMFLLNQLLIRNADPSIFGFASIQMDLLLNTVLFLSREAIRLTALRTKCGVEQITDRYRTHFVNLAWLTVPFGALLTALVHVYFVWVRPAQEIPHYNASVLVFCVAALLETLIEPVFIVLQSFMLYTVRGAVESAATFVRCLVSYILLVHFDQGLLGFAFGQLAFAAALLLGYAGYVVWSMLSPESALSRGMKSVWAFFPSRLPPCKTVLERLFDGQSLRLTGTFFAQSGVKFLLTQGDKLLLSFRSELLQSGVFGVVSNYGSFAARLLFQPLEETARAMFAKLALSGGPGAMRGVLYLLLRFQVLVGLVFIAFGVNYSDAFVDLLLGARWRAAGVAPVLSWFCGYLLVMALNGMLEAFFFAVQDQAALKRYNGALLAFFALYAGAAALFMQRFGVVGIVLSNAFNLALRCIWCGRAAAAYFRGRGVEFSLWRALPSPAVLAALCCCFAASLCSRFWTGTLAHCCVGALLFSGFCATVFKADGAEYSRLWGLRAGHGHGE